MFQVPCVHIEYSSWPMKPWHTLTFPNVQKKSPQKCQTLAHNVFDLPCAQKGSLSKPPFPPFIIAAMADIIIAIWRVKALKKTLYYLANITSGTKKNIRMYLHTFSCFYTFPPALPNSFPFPLSYFAHVTSEHVGCIAEFWLHFVQSWGGNLPDGIQLMSS